MIIPITLAIWALGVDIGKNIFYIPYFFWIY
jgi:hypothetical protein